MSTKGAAILANISQFVSGNGDPSTTQLVLIWAAVVGGILVGSGIIWESWRDNHLWTLPTACVFFGVIIEASATIFLFEFDEKTIRSQNAEIISLLPRRLTGDAAKKFEDVLSAAPMHLPIGVVSRILDSEGQDFADDIAEAFKKDGWMPVRQKDWTLSDKGVFIATFEGTTLPPDIEKAIADALDAASIPHKKITITGAEQNTTSAHFQPNTLYLIVGAHP